jgi:hypothetical protein
MAQELLPDPELLRKLLRHDPETGKLFWRERDASLFRSARGWAMWNSRYAHKESFLTESSSGYWCGCIFKKCHPAHRVIWAMVHGEWPKQDIDHINGIRKDNRIGNLRSVSRSENLQNQKLSIMNTSGRVGVYWNKFTSQWMAQIKVSGKSIFLGRFNTFEEAEWAREDAEKRYGFHPNHGRR